jgi:hypothetical protein
MPEKERKTGGEENKENKENQENTMKKEKSQ